MKSGLSMHRACLLAKILALTALSTFAFVSAHAQSQKRDANIAEIVKLVKVEDLIRINQTEAQAAANMRLDELYAGMTDRMRKMTPETKERMQAALSKYMTKVTTGYDPADAAKVWGSVFASNFTDDELDKVVEFSRTEFGAKLLKSSVTASSQWNTDIRQARLNITKAAYAQLITDMRAILDSIAKAKDAGAPSSVQ